MAAFEHLRADLASSRTLAIPFTNLDADSFLLSTLMSETCTGATQLSLNATAKRYCVACGQSFVGVERKLAIQLGLR